MIEGPWPLPSDWEWARFGDVATVDSDLVDPAQFGDSPHVAPNHMESGSGRLLPYGTIAADGVTSPKHRFRSGHIIYSKIRPYLAKAVLVNFNGLCSADCYPVSTKLDARFLHRWLVSPMFTEMAVGKEGRTLLPKINQKDLAELLVPVPPRQEQVRIAERLEGLLADVREARAELDAVPRLVERLRRSVLAAAFRGDLTATWREAHPDVEPAPALLDRIRTERRRRWDAANPRKRYVEPDPIDPDAEGLPDLPPGWCWVRLEALLSELRNGIATSPNADAGQPILRISAVRPLAVDMTDVRFLPESDEWSRFTLTQGDLLFTRYNGNAELVGACAVVPDPGRAVVYPDKLIRGRTVIVRPEFVAAAMSTEAARVALRAASKTAAGQVGISGSDLRAVPVPLPPLAEQDVIIAVVNASETTRRTALSEIAVAERELWSIERSLLARAFRGELVPSDVADASVGTAQGPARPASSIAAST